MCPSYKKRGFWFVDSRYTWLDLGIKAKCQMGDKTKEKVCSKVTCTEMITEDRKMFYMCIIFFLAVRKV